jgi:hypothetical protein
MNLVPVLIQLGGALAKFSWKSFTIVKLLESLQRTILTKIANELPFAKCQYDV